MGSDRPGGCDGGTPAGTAKRQFAVGRSPTSPLYLSLCVGVVCYVWIGLISKDLAVFGV